MAAAVKKSRANRQVARRAAGRSESAAITSVVFDDNGGDYCSTILASDGESLAQSRPYAGHDDAAYAAPVVRDDAGSGTVTDAHIRILRRVARQRRLELDGHDAADHTGETEAGRRRKAREARPRRNAEREAEE